MTCAHPGERDGLRGDHRGHQAAGGGLSRDTAERAAQATLQTLAERLPRGEARHILQGAVRSARRRWSTWWPPFPSSTNRWSWRHSSATWRSCRPTSSGAGSGSRSLGLGRAEARQVTEAALETLAERIAAGQVEDLMAQLDPLLHPPLRQGMASATPGRGACPLRTSCGRSRRGRAPGPTRKPCSTRVRACPVFGRLSEAVSRKEWFDIVVELPEDHRPRMPAGIA